MRPSRTTTPRASPRSPCRPRWSAPSSDRATSTTSVSRPGPVNRRRVAVVEGGQSVESEPNDEVASASPVSFPGGAAGRIVRAGDLDHFRVRARKGERMIVEVFARRLGTPLDPFLEVLDPQGRPVPRAVLRPVAETEVA